MYKIRINKLEKEIVIDGNVEQLAVTFDIFIPGGDVATEEYISAHPEIEGLKVGDPIDKVVRTARHGYALDTPKEEIIADLEQCATSAQTDDENAERNAEHEAKHEIADDTIAALAGRDLDTVKDEIKED